MSIRFVLWMQALSAHTACPVNACARNWSWLVMWGPQSSVDEASGSFLTTHFSCLGLFWGQSACWQRTYLKTWQNWFSSILKIVEQGLLFTIKNPDHFWRKANLMLEWFLLILGASDLKWSEYQQSSNRKSLVGIAKALGWKWQMRNMCPYALVSRGSMQGPHSCVAAEAQIHPALFCICYTFLGI